MNRPGAYVRARRGVRMYARPRGPASAAGLARGVGEQGLPPRRGPPGGALRQTDAEDPTSPSDVKFWRRRHGRKPRSEAGARGHRESSSAGRGKPDRPSVAGGLCACARRRAGGAAAAGGGEPCLLPACRRSRRRGLGGPAWATRSLAPPAPRLALRPRRLPAPPAPPLGRGRPSSPVVVRRGCRGATGAEGAVA